jgi:hypothetical protein
MTSQLNTMLVAQQQSDRLAGAERARVTRDAAPRPQRLGSRHVWQLRRRRPAVA